MDVLKRTQEFIVRMNASNSVIAKKDVLRSFTDLHTLLEATYNPFKQYYLKSSNIKKHSHLRSECFYESIFDLLNALSSREITGYKAIGCVNTFIEQNKEYEDVIYLIIDKDLKCRAGTKIINDVFPGCIPVFDIALAQSNYDDVKHRVNVTDYCASHKLDGCRCLITIDHHYNIKFLSREGKEFFTLDSLKNEVMELNRKNVVLDGEICIVDPETGKEDFKKIMKVIRRKNFTIPNPKFKAFDAISYNDFYSGTSEKLLSERLFDLSNILEGYSGDKIEMVEQIPVESTEHLTQLRQTARDKGWEGLILRKNAPYKGTRSNDLLKIKDMIDAEYKVLGIETGPFRIIEDSLEKEVETLTAVNIVHKDNVVSVGSGFTLKERNLYYNNPEKIIGKIITVKYFEETINEKGAFSLRFPIFKYNHGDERTT